MLNCVPFILLKSNTSLIVHLKIINDVTFVNSFCGLNMNSYGLWFDFS